MKDKIIKFVKTYLLFILIFLVQKILFMIWYRDIYTDSTFTDYLLVLWNGLKLDASVAGYFTIIPGILLIISLWIRKEIIQFLQKIYFGIFSFLLSVVFVVDLVLYEYWGFRLDSTPLFYMRSPLSAFASVDWLTLIFGFLAILLLTVSFYWIFKKFIIQTSARERLPYNVFPIAGCLLLLTALLFIPIRGGFSVSTMNVGKVYFSSKLELNHAAINPYFSLLESISREQNFADQYRFMSDEEAQAEFKELVDKPLQSDSIKLFATQHPNIIFVILESFMSKVVEPLGGLPDITPSLNKLCEEGVLFTNFYANSFRTDRALVSIISGYPAQPTTSIMKYPRKSQSLPSIPKSLKKEGYDLQYYYGGDADFTNMRSYLMSCGINNIISDQDFPLNERLSKWGALDGVVFTRLTNDLKGDQKQPFMKILQTSSSHEPFDVPSNKLSDPYLNSVHYTDSCLGAFIREYKKTPYWENSVIVLVPDHAMRFPSILENYSIDRYKIPLLLVGGAVKQPMRVESYASQIDIAATLLAQLEVSHDDFVFSKNILNPVSPHFGYFTSPDLFGMITAENQLVYNCGVKQVITDEGENKSENLKKGQALLQILYDDLSQR